ncbi:MAG: ubiquinone/menaquinone biosynthesis methyltransferase [Deltaproteobacteria bacterium]|nr:MAG: ubiquinone/menaquinone biosynthesis methyltransferase [Deltaproteobacteria bacterium]
MTSSSNMQRQQLVQTLFNRIAHRYDLLNRIISFHCDVRWREKTVKALSLKSSDRFVLDLGTGTGDLALTAAKRLGGEARIFGLDFSLEMLRLAQAKKKDSYGDKIAYILGTALDPPFKDEAFDAVMTAFVLRNIPDLALFFRQAFRVLKPGGRLVSLDMFPPSSAPFSFLYALYFYRLVPWIGASLAHDRNAYQYLADSVRTFNPPEAVGNMIQQAGFVRVRIEKFLKGAVCLHVGEKPPARVP